MKSILSSSDGLALSPRRQQASIPPRLPPRLVPLRVRVVASNDVASSTWKFFKAIVERVKLRVHRVTAHHASSGAAMLTVPRSTSSNTSSSSASVATWAVSNRTSVERLHSTSTTVTFLSATMLEELGNEISCSDASSPWGQSLASSSLWPLLPCRSTLDEPDRLVLASLAPRTKTNAGPSCPDVDDRAAM